MKNTISEESHFIANFLAKHEDSYELLGIGNLTETHNFLSSVLNIKASSFRRLRDEYDGFYSNRKGYPDVVNRNSRVEYKLKFESLNKDSYLKKIKSLIGLDSKCKINEKRISRLAFNSNGWIMPSGSYGKSNHKESHEANYGYGHEEWLFDISKIIDGYHYGFLEPIRKQQDAYSGNTYDVWLYTIDGVSKSRYWVGEISNIEVINQEKANSIKSVYKKNGWLKEMEEQIVQSGGNNTGFSDWKGVDLFNVRFKPKNLIVNDPYYKLSSNHPVTKLSRYNFSHFRNDFNTITENKNKKAFSFIADEEDKNDEESEGIKKTKHKREPKTIEITYLHKAISNQLTKVLKKEYGNSRVKAEHPIGVDSNRIDIVVNSETEGLIFYEIKTYNSVKSSIREALGQLFEYSFWPNTDNAEQLIIITQKHNNLEDVKSYFKHLRDKIGISIYYQWFDIETNELSEKY
ncbi:hypothetical protein V1T75_00240 [Tenacibaculum sp. FZY0031]|uniref:hypothetical protein n=1 Tax=unclassified Tenacibaculum TaxID=2635139 RepID=UPI002EBCDB14|nr:hypothetical protein [Tenacibaculum sp. FZY0031]